MRELEKLEREVGTEQVLMPRVRFFSQALSHITVYINMFFIKKIVEKLQPYYKWICLFFTFFFGFT